MTSFDFITTKCKVYGCREIEFKCTKHPLIICKICTKYKNSKNTYMLYSDIPYYSSSDSDFSSTGCRHYICIDNTYICDVYFCDNCNENEAKFKTTKGYYYCTNCIMYQKIIINDDILKPFSLNKAFNISTQVVRACVADFDSDADSDDSHTTLIHAKIDLRIEPFNFTRYCCPYVRLLLRCRFLASSSTEDNKRIIVKDPLLEKIICIGQDWLFQLICCFVYSS